MHCGKYVCEALVILFADVVRVFPPSLSGFQLLPTNFSDYAAEHKTGFNCNETVGLVPAHSTI